ncbi:MAG: ATP-dependent zinc metalloprotease FtsH [Clostridia bacterium]|nr:ATP-dependent zinc metalloprotease FtsH [Clostridia bacterium]
MNNNRNERRIILPLILILFFLVASQFMSSLMLTGRRGTQIDSSKLLGYIDQDMVDAVAIEGSTAFVHLKKSQIPITEFSDSKYDFSAVIGSDFVLNCRQIAAKKSGLPLDQISTLDLGYDLYYMRNNTPTWLLEMIPYLVTVLLLIGFWFFMFRQQGNAGPMMGFGHSPAKIYDRRSNIRFSDVAGAVEEKEEMMELVDFLKNPRRFTDVGARIPKGVLLVGPPGTGKTLMAKAVAGEAGVPFMSISGSDFVEMFVGVGASRVRDLFEQAKRHSPCIVFIDEIDAVGRRRGAGMGGGHDEREQTLNQLLVEMDGFAPNEGVIVLAATNRKDILDPALLRPGRFDRQITVGYPDVRGREQILKVHSHEKPLADDVDLSVVAKRTPYCSGADLENIMNEAAILCARSGQNRITARNISDAIERVQMGPEKRSHIVSDADKRLVAYHEAGHAIVGEMLEGCDKVHLVTIMPRGGSGGHTLLLPETESDFTTRQQLLDYIAMALGGYAAEGLVLGQVSTGASSDLQRATEICRRMVMQYGMSDDMGPIYLGNNQNEVFVAMEYGSQAKTYSEELASRIDREIQAKMNTALERARTVLRQNMDKLDGLSRMLVEKETIDRAEFETFMYGQVRSLEAKDAG